MWQKLTTQLAKLAAEGVWQGWVMGALTGTTASQLLQWMAINPLPAVCGGVLIAVVIGVVVSVIYTARHKKSIRTHTSLVLPDKSAATELTHTILKDTKKRFDLLAPTGRSLLTGLHDQIVTALARDVEFRILLLDANSPAASQFATSTGRTVNQITHDIQEAGIAVDSIKRALAANKASKIVVKHFNNIPLYSMWIRDGTLVNVEVLLFDGRGRGPIIHGADPVLVAKFVNEFDTLWVSIP